MSKFKTTLQKANEKWTKEMPNGKLYDKNQQTTPVVFRYKCPFKLITNATYTTFHIPFSVEFGDTNIKCAQMNEYLNQYEQNVSREPNVKCKILTINDSKSNPHGSGTIAVTIYRSMAAIGALSGAGAGVATEIVRSYEAEKYDYARSIRKCANLGSIAGGVISSAVVLSSYHVNKQWVRLPPRGIIFWGMASIGIAGSSHLIRGAAISLREMFGKGPPEEEESIYA